MTTQHLYLTNQPSWPLFLVERVLLSSALYQSHKLQTWTSLLTFFIPWIVAHLIKPSNILHSFNSWCTLSWCTMSWSKLNFELSHNSYIYIYLSNNYVVLMIRLCYLDFGQIVEFLGVVLYHENHNSLHQNFLKNVKNSQNSGSLVKWTCSTTYHYIIIPRRLLGCVWCAR